MTLSLGREDSLEDVDTEQLNRERSMLDTAILQMTSDNDPGALRLKNVWPSEHSVLRRTAYAQFDYLTMTCPLSHVQVITHLV